MRRTQISLTDKQYQFIMDKVEETGLSMSELIRREIDKWQEKENTKTK